MHATSSTTSRAGEACSREPLLADRRDAGLWRNDERSIKSVTTHPLRESAMIESTGRSFILAALATAALAGPAAAQPSGYYGGPPPGAVRGNGYGFVIGGNNTGGTRSVIIPRGATGADTYFSSSAVGGNVARPELAVPNGSAGGGGGGGAR